MPPGPRQLISFASLVLTATLLGACSTTQESAPVVNIEPGLSIEDEQLEANDGVESILTERYRSWRGVSYRHGGLSETGIDCSGFVYRIFRDSLGIELPRTTWAQREVGVQVPVGELSAGDLVFFRTGRVDRHVGIYLSDSRFMHVSTSRGVTISNLRSAYWATRFQLARRVAALTPPT